MRDFVTVNFKHKLVDAAVNLLAFDLAAWLFGRLAVFTPGLLLWLPLFTIAAVLFFGSWHPLYSSHRIISIRQEIREISGIFYRAYLTVFFILCFFSPEYFLLFYLLKYFLLVYLVLSLSGVCAARYLIRLWLRWRRRRGQNIRRTLIIGTGREAAAVTREIKTNNKEWGAAIAGYVALNARSRSSAAVPKTKILGRIEIIGDLLRSQVIDDVLIAINPADHLLVQEAILTCEAMGINIKVKELMTFLQRPRTRALLDYIGNMQCISFVTYPAGSCGLLLKRLFDIAAAGLGLLFLLPLVFLPVAVLIKLTSRGPVFFRQERVGARNRLFKIYKFRTMVLDAEAQKAGLLRKNENKNGITFKIKNDPRLTGPGRFLRRTSIDELPQLFNVFLGQMSLVGPRPALPEEVKKYTDDYRKRIAVRPGITGLWQISGRSDNADFDRWVALDAQYIDTWSFWQDLVILFKTIPVVLKGSGAY
ncbi:MAG: sugar transferase [Candidatus Margulisbacteria bacterium]|jgi:exopolysaccharide biosynthesis polyprenyl glycosylphosphotransferase|nr:sugar transferase [Candidatus Margulisiibacteriota bacterium]